MPFSVLNFGNYLLPVSEVEKEVELDGYDGFFDQAFGGMKEGDAIDFVVNAFSQVVKEKLWSRDREAPFELEPATVERVFREAMGFRYLFTQISEYQGDSHVIVKVNDECLLGDFVDGARRAPLAIEALQVRAKTEVGWYLREETHSQGFWPDEGCPLPSVEMLRLAERHGVHGVGLAERYRRKHLLVKHRGGSGTGADGTAGFTALFLGTNDRESCFLIEIPSIAEYEELLGSYAAAAESEEEKQIWKSRLSLRALA